MQEDVVVVVRSGARERRSSNFGTPEAPCRCAHIEATRSTRRWKGAVQRHHLAESRRTVANKIVALSSKEPRDVFNMLAAVGEGLLVAPATAVAHLRISRQDTVTPAVRVISQQFTVAVQKRKGCLGKSGTRVMKT